MFCLGSIVIFRWRTSCFAWREEVFVFWGLQYLVRRVPDVQNTMTSVQSSSATGRMPYGTQV